MLVFDSTVTLLLRRGMRRGVATVGRERGWGSTLGALFGTMLAVQLLLLAGIGVQGFEALTRAQMDLRLPIRAEARDADIQALFAAVRQHPEVADATYITKEQSLARERARNPGLDAFLGQSTMGNPFADTFVVRLRTPEDTDAFSAFIQSPAWAQTVDPAFLSRAADQENEARDALHLAAAARTLLFVLLLLQVGVLLFVLLEFSARRMAARRAEVTVEKMAGAQEMAVLLPFATENALLLFLAFFLSAVLLVLLLFFLPALLPSVLQADAATFFPHMSQLLRAELPLLFGLEIVLMPFAALFAAWMGTRGTEI